MYFFLQRRTPVLLTFLVAKAPTVLADVTWDSPVTGDVYVPGDTLHAVWTSPAKVVSPSFTICTGTNKSTSTKNDPDCGTAVWPSVKRNGTEYSISLAIPNITGNGDYYLVMKDDTGVEYDTPSFSLALENTAATNITAISSSSQPTSTSITYVPSHAAPAAAAIAVPLSLVAAVLIGALLLLFFRVRRCRQRERDKQKQLRETGGTRSSSRQSTMSFASATDIERAVWALSANRGYSGAAPFAHPPLPASMGGSFVGPGLNTAAAATLGTSAFGWAHGLTPVMPPVADAYTPAPVQRFAKSSAPNSLSRPYSTRMSVIPQSEHLYHEQEAVPRPINWREVDWRSTGRMFVEEPTSLGPPQLPEIQVHASSPPVHTYLPPSVPPKQLFPGRLDIHAPRAYAPPYDSRSLSSVLESHLPPTPGVETHASLSVISNYMQASPAPPQDQHCAPSNVTIPELSALRVPPTSLIRARSLRRLETVHNREDHEKPLPLRPQDRMGTDLYGAVSRAVEK